MRSASDFAFRELPDDPIPAIVSLQIKGYSIRGECGKSSSREALRVASEKKKFYFQLLFVLLSCPLPANFPGQRPNRRRLAHGSPARREREKQRRIFFLIRKKATLGEWVFAPSAKRFFLFSTFQLCLRQHNRHSCLRFGTCTFFLSIYSRK